MTTVNDLINELRKLPENAVVKVFIFKSSVAKTGVEIQLYEDDTPGLAGYVNIPAD